jgi:capsular polysaccharide transport system permease protein
MTEIARPVARPRSFRTPRTIGALILREMQTTYGRNVGGYIWAILEPVGAIALFTLVIAVGLKVRMPGIGTSFPLFYATGFLPFSLAMGMAARIAAAISYSRPLLFYPGVQFTDAIIARFVLWTLAQFTVFVIVMTGIYLAFDVSTIRDEPTILAAFLLAALFGLGVGTLNCFLFSVAPVWVSIWSILSRPLLLLSCIFYAFEDVPRQWQDVLWYNPLVHIVGLMRRGFYATHDAAYLSVLYPAGIGLVCLVLGLVFLNRFHRDILNRQL